MILKLDRSVAPAAVCYSNAVRVREVLVSLGLCGVVLSGCATPHGLTPLAIDVGPAVREYTSPDFNSFSYRTFSVFPLSAVRGDAEMKGEAYERPLLYAVRNILEARGYKWVPASESPDFLVGVDAAPAAMEKSKSAHVVAAPDWAPGQAMPGALALAALTPYDVWGWGTPPPLEAAVAPLPAYPPPPGRPDPFRSYEGWYLCRVKVAVVDGKSFGETWVGTGAGVSRVPDSRVGSQTVLWAVLHQLPAASAAEMWSGGWDLSGLNFEVLSADGARFYPGLLDVENKSAAWKAGLLPFDLVIGIGGETTCNRSWADVRRMLLGPPHSGTTLTLWRNGQQVNVSAKRAPLAEARAVPVAVPGAGKKAEFLRISRGRTESSKLWALVGGAALVAITTVVVVSR